MGMYGKKWFLRGIMLLTSGEMWGIILADRKNMVNRGDK